jgi:hypothetical protein
MAMLPEILFVPLYLPQAANAAQRLFLSRAAQQRLFPLCGEPEN